MQMALANPPDPLRNPPRAAFVNTSQQQIKAWIREQIAKQHRHERNVFWMEFSYSRVCFCRGGKNTGKVHQGWDSRPIFESPIGDQKPHALGGWMAALPLD
jgi:hypothetical protein